MTKQKLSERVEQLEQVVRKLTPPEPESERRKEHFLFEIPDGCRVVAFRDYFIGAWDTTDNMDR